LETFVPTVAWSLRPARFWSAVRIEHPIHARTLVVYAVSLVALAHLVVFLATAINFRYTKVAFMGWGLRPPTGWSLYRATFEAAAWPYSLDDPSYYDFPPFAGLWPWALVCLTILTPIAHMILSDTFGLARVRFEHLLRAWAYSMVVVPVTAAVFAVGCSIPDASLATMRWRWLFFLGGAIWLVRWWWVVSHRYLRLPQAGLATIAVFSISALGSAAILSLLELIGFQGRA